MAATREHRAMLDRAHEEARRLEARRESFQQSLKADIVLRTGAESEKRVVGLRHLRQLQAHQKEAEQQAKSEQRKREMEEKQRRNERESQEYQQLEQQFRQEESIARQRQSIRDNSWELRELESKLKSAYATKECVGQIKEHQVLKQKEKLVELQEAEQWREELAIAAEQEEAQEVLHLHKRAEYRKDLQEQLVELEQRRKEEYETFLAEKKMVDEVVQKILEADAREAERRMEEQEETKRFIQNFIQQRQDWKLQEQQRIAEENRKIEQYALEQRQREEQQQAAKKEVEAHKNEIYERLAKEMAEKERGKLELESLRVEFYAEEESERLKQREQDRIEKRIRQRLELIEAFRQQSEEKRQRIDKELAEEEKYRAELLARYAEEARLEQLNDQKRRQKQLEHRRAAEKVIQERRERLEAERRAFLDQDKELDALAKFRVEVIEQERQKLLREHASKLVGFLPKGLLRDEKDLELFDEEFRSKFQSKKPQEELDE